MGGEIADNDGELQLKNMFVISAQLKLRNNITCNTINCLAVHTFVTILSQSISFLMTQKMKNKRKTTSTTSVACTTHMEILVTYCRVVAFIGSWVGAEKAHVMKNANRAKVKFII